jgi:hypothetical protein
MLLDGINGNNLSNSKLSLLSTKLLPLWKVELIETVKQLLVEELNDLQQGLPDRPHHGEDHD